MSRDTQLKYVLFVSLGVWVVLSVVDLAVPGFHGLEYISALGTYTVAVATAMYVIVTRSQLGIMSSQLEAMMAQLQEASAERELLSQSLPFIRDVEIKVEKPRAFYTPPGKRQEFMSLYEAVATVANEGTGSAINIEVYCRIGLPSESGDVKVLEAYPGMIDILPEQKDQELHLHFTSDVTGEFIDSLRGTTSAERPFMIFMVLFRNTSGGFFVLRNGWQVRLPGDEEHNMLGEWIAAITAFPVKFRAERARVLEAARCDDAAAILREFKVLEDRVGEIPGQDLKLECFMSKESFEVKHVTQEEYLKSHWVPADEEAEKGRQFFHSWNTARKALMEKAASSGEATKILR